MTFKHLHELDAITTCTQCGQHIQTTKESGDIPSCEYHSVELIANEHLD